MSRIDAALELLESQRKKDRYHPGAQLYVSHWGDVVCDQAVGRSEEGVDLTPDHLLPWYDITKPLVAVAIMQLFESGALNLEDRVSSILEGWDGSKANCTIRHLLTHMDGLAHINFLDQDIEPSAASAELRLAEPEFRPGTKAHYGATASWRVLAEIIKAVDGRDIEWFLREQVWDPLGMQSTYLGISESDQTRLGTWLTPMHWTGLQQTVIAENGRAKRRSYRVDHLHTTTQHRLKVEPGMGAVGPAHDIGTFLNAILKGGEGIFRHRSTAALMVAAQRIEVRDLAFGGARLPWGLGVQLAGGMNGTLGTRAFGHDALTSGRAICDPIEGLVMVLLTNGACTEYDGAIRAAQVTEAVYDAVVPRPAGALRTMRPNELGYDAATSLYS
ncbi:MAG: serine hydrolase domain-containing protein [Acidimicrobiales bacterium]